MDSMKFRSLLHMNYGKRAAPAPGTSDLNSPVPDTNNPSAEEQPPPPAMGAANTAPPKRLCEDVDKKTSYAPPVIHEVVKPVVHEIKQEQVFKEVHEHEVHHKILPVIDVEVLPPKHFVPGPDGRLMEVAASDLPECTGDNQNWHLEKGAACGLSMPGGETGKQAAVSESGTRRPGSLDR